MESVKIETLQNESQWSTWRFQVKITLIAADAYDVVTGDHVKPSATADAELKAWKKCDATAQRIIGTTVGSGHITHIKNCKTAKEMWDKLHSVFERKNEMSLLLLYQQFFTFTKDEEEGIMSYFSRLEDLVIRLSDLGEKVSDEMVATKIIMSLPPEYSSFSSAWESVNKAERTLENLRARLTIEEDRLAARGVIETAEALMAKKSNISENKQNKKNGRKYNKNDKSKSKCFSCGEMGHWSRECPNKSSDEQAFICNVSTTAKTDVWLLDSGASHHMTNKRDWFSDYQEEIRDIKIAKGVMKSAGKGTIPIRYFNGRQWNNGKLLDVVFVPELANNLFSQNHALDQGLKIEATSTHCKFVSKTGCTVLVGVRRGPMTVMQIDVKKSKDVAMSANAEMDENRLRVWHEKLGHQNLAHVRNFLKENKIKFEDEQYTCEACLYGKHHRSTFPNREEKSVKCGQIIHADVCGPMQVTSFGGSRYFLLFKDDYSHFRMIYCIRQKSDVFEKIKTFVKLAENAYGHNICILRTDNGTEFLNEDVKKFLDQEGIRHQRTVPYTPEQNGTAEREMRTIVESARTMIYARQMDLRFWAEAVNVAVFVLNRSGTSTVVGKTPFELWAGKKARIDQLQPFGTTVFVHVPKERRQKFNSKAEKCVFVGYDENVKGFRVWNPITGKIQITRDVKFINEFPNTVEVKTNSIIENAENIPISMKECVQRNSDDVFEDAQDSPSSLEPEQKPEITSGWCGVDNTNIVDNRLRNHRDQTCSLENGQTAIAMMSIDDGPRTYEEAITSNDSDRWMEAMATEIDSLKRNGTWNLVEPPNSQKVIDNKWVFKIKTKANGNVDCYKARLVARGFTQEYGIDYQETFSPVVKFSSIRTILSIAAKEDLILKQFDVKTAFLYGDLQEDVFMKQPVGFEDGSGRVCKLVKSLYGLKQASRCWNKKFTTFINKFNFVACSADPCVFVCGKDGVRIILAIYVDDGLIAASTEASINPLIDFLREELEIKLFNAEYFLGLELKKLDSRSILLHQTSYAKRILDRFNMSECSGVATPVDSNQILDDSPDSEISTFPYREAVGSLMYLAVATRPDISFAVGVVSRFLEKPTYAHVTAVKRILKYIKATYNYGIRFDPTESIELLGYSDADYAGDRQTRRSTSAYVFLFGGNVISWSSERQKCVALSTTESEYMAASNAIKELLWLQNLLMELIGADVKTTFLMDNQSAIRLIKNPEFHKRTKHIDVRYHFIREKFEEGRFNLDFVPSEEQVADVLTKGLPKGRFSFLRGLLNIVEDGQ